MSEQSLDVDLGAQVLSVQEGGRITARYAVSTAARGAGEHEGSLCTPRGRHIIRAMIGRGAPAGTVFVARRPTGEIYTPALGQAQPGRDWILTRILWLSGTERGFNRLGARDTMRRYIYIHGTPEETALGAPGSHGCIRMGNGDVVELFERVHPGMPVLIHE